MIAAAQPAYGLHLALEWPAWWLITFATAVLAWVCLALLRLLRPPVGDERRLGWGMRCCGRLLGVSAASAAGCVVLVTALGGLGVAQTASDVRGELFGKLLGWAGSELFAWLTLVTLAAGALTVWWERRVRLSRPPSAPTPRGS